MATPRRLTLKVLCPEKSVDYFVGVNAKNVSKIQQRSNIEIVFSKRGEYFPGKVGERVVSISGFNLDTITEVFDDLHDVIHNLGGRGVGKPQCILALTNDASGEILGTRGSRLSSIREQHPKMRVYIQKQCRVNHSIKERYIEFTSDLGDLKQVRSFVRQVLAIICGPKCTQPVHNQTYKTHPLPATNHYNSNALQPVSRNQKVKKVPNLLQLSPDTVHSVTKAHQDSNVSSHRGAQWHKPSSYTVYSISRDSATGEPMFREL